MIAITSTMTALAIYKHKSNIQRLIKGTETRLGKPGTARRPSPTASP
jgi:hypothetical protein